MKLEREKIQQKAAIFLLDLSLGTKQAKIFPVFAEFFIFSAWFCIKAVAVLQKMLYTIDTTRRAVLLQRLMYPPKRRKGKARKEMILITGDTHGDFSRFQQPAVKKLKKEDALIICGDFGFVWDGSKKEQQLLKKIGRRRHDTLFVEGCRDNYDLLKNYPVVDYHGGQARQISGRLYQLLRGEIYELGGRKVFAFGGGYSDEEWLDVGHSSGMWWSEEQPSEEEMSRGLAHLRMAGGHVDLIVSHDAPASIRRFIRIDDNEVSALHAYLDQVAKSCSFDRWFFGHYHLDKVVPPRFIAVFQSVQQVG